MNVPTRASGLLMLAITLCLAPTPAAHADDREDRTDATDPVDPAAAERLQGRFNELTACGHVLRIALKRELGSGLVSRCLCHHRNRSSRRVSRSVLV